MWPVLIFFYVAAGSAVGTVGVPFLGLSVVFLLILGLGVLGLRFAQGDKIVSSYVAVALPFGVWVLVSGVASWSGGTMYRTIAFLTWLVILPGLAAWFRSSAVRAAYVTGCAVVGGVFTAVIMYRVATTGEALDPVLGTVLGTNRNAVASALVFLLPLVASGRRWFWLRIGGVVLLLVSTLALGSRAAIIGAVIGLLFSLFLVPGRRHRFIAAFIVVATLGFFVMPSLFATLGFSVERFRSLNDPQLHTDEELRHLVLRKAVLLAEEHPFFGIGLGNFERTVTQIPERATFDVNQRRVDRYQAHNTFAEALAAFGFPGLAAYAVFVLFPLWLGIKRRSIQSIRGPTGAYLGLVIWSGFHSALGSTFLFLAAALIFGAAMSKAEEPAVIVTA